jgi:hypothetical protein
MQPRKSNEPLLSQWFSTVAGVEKNLAWKGTGELLEDGRMGEGERLQQAVNMAKRGSKREWERLKFTGIRD